MTVKAVIRRVLVWLCDAVDAHVRGWCPCPLCDISERAARPGLGMPARHPEFITRDLPAGQEEHLAALAAELWPADEYEAIIDAWREGRS
jgi:hypothetical protein